MTNPCSPFLKQIRNRSSYLSTLLVLICVITFASCSSSQKDEFNRSVNVFFLGVLQVINLMLLGVPAMIFSIISANNGKKVLFVLGIVFLVIFSFFSIMGFLEVISIGPKHFDVYYLFIFELLLLTGSIVCLVIANGKKPEITDPDAKLYKDILEEELE